MENIRSRFRKQAKSPKTDYYSQKLVFDEHKRGKGKNLTVEMLGKY